MQSLIEWNSVAVSYRTQHCEYGTSFIPIDLLLSD
jgi:hypothetical protein